MPIPNLNNPYYIAANIKIGQHIQIHAQKDGETDSAFKDFPGMLLYNNEDTTYIMPNTISVLEAVTTSSEYNFCTIQGSSICFGTTNSNADDKGPQDTNRNNCWDLYLNSNHELSIIKYTDNNVSQDFLTLSDNNIKVSKPLTGVDADSINIITVNAALSFDSRDLLGVKNITATSSESVAHKIISGFSSIQADSFKTSDDTIVLNPSATYCIHTSGSISASSFYATSDVRLKTNIKPYTPKTSILDLPIYEFDYKSSGQHTIGCLAQDLQKICPEIVSEDEDGFLHIEESKLIYLLLEEVRRLKVTHYE